MITERCVEATALAGMMREWGTAHPYSTVDIFLGRGPAVGDLGRARPGVCFDLNTAFAAHLGRAGLDASLHPAGVQDHDSPHRADVGSHVTVVTVLDGAPHLTDIGLGCGPLRPIPLSEGVYPFSGADFRLSVTEREGRRWWRLAIPSTLSRAFVAMEFCAEPDPVAAVARADHFLSPSTSPLRDVLLIQGWAGHRLITAHGRTVSVRTGYGVLSRDIHRDVTGWREAIHTWFPGTFDDADLGAAWARLETLGP